MGIINLSEVPIGSKIIHTEAKILNETVSWIVADDVQYGNDGIVLISEKAVIIDKIFKDDAEFNPGRFVGNSEFFNVKLNDMDKGYLKDFPKEFKDALMTITVGESNYCDLTGYSTTYPGKVHILAPNESGGHLGYPASSIVLIGYGKNTFKCFMNGASYLETMIRAKPTQSALTYAGLSNSPSSYIDYYLRGILRSTSLTGSDTFPIVRGSGSGNKLGALEGKSYKTNNNPVRIFIKLPLDTRVREPIGEDNTYEIVFDAKPSINIFNLDYPYIYFDVNDKEGEIVSVTISINGTLVKTYPTYAGGPLMFKIDKSQTLNVGENTIKINATDSIGNTSTENIIINKANISTPVVGDNVIISGKLYQVQGIVQEDENFNLQLDKDIISNLEYIEIANSMPKVYVDCGKGFNLINHENTKTEAGVSEDKFTIHAEGRSATFKIDMSANDIESANYIEKLQATFEYKED